MKNENFDNVINENCPIVLQKLVKNDNFDYVINDQTPILSPVINRNHLEPPSPSADYVIHDDPLLGRNGMSRLSNEPSGNLSSRAK